MVVYISPRVAAYWGVQPGQVVDYSVTYSSGSSGGGGGNAVTATGLTQEQNIQNTVLNSQLLAAGYTPSMGGWVSPSGQNVGSTSQAIAGMGAQGVQIQQNISNQQAAYDAEQKRKESERIANIQSQIKSQAKIAEEKKQDEPVFKKKTSQVVEAGSREQAYLFSAGLAYGAGTKVEGTPYESLLSNLAPTEQESIVKTGQTEGPSRFGGVSLVSGEGVSFVSPANGEMMSREQIGGMSTYYKPEKGKRVAESITSHEPYSEIAGTSGMAVTFTQGNNALDIKRASQAEQAFAATPGLIGGRSLVGGGPAGAVQQEEKQKETIELPESYYEGQKRQSNIIGKAFTDAAVVGDVAGKVIPFGMFLPSDTRKKANLAIGGVIGGSAAATYRVIGMQGVGTVESANLLFLPENDARRQSIKERIKAERMGAGTEAFVFGVTTAAFDAGLKFAGTKFLGIKSEPMVGVPSESATSYGFGNAPQKVYYSEGISRTASADNLFVVNVEKGAYKIRTGGLLETIGGALGEKNVPTSLSNLNPTIKTTRIIGGKPIEPANLPSAVATEKGAITDINQGVSDVRLKVQTTTYPTGTSNQPIGKTTGYSMKGDIYASKGVEIAPGIVKQDVVLLGKKGQANVFEFISQGSVATSRSKPIDLGGGTIERLTGTENFMSLRKVGGEIEYITGTKTTRPQALKTNIPTSEPGYSSFGTVKSGGKPVAIVESFTKGEPQMIPLKTEKIPAFRAVGKKMPGFDYAKKPEPISTKPQETPIAKPGSAQQVQIQKQEGMEILKSKVAYDVALYDKPVSIQTQRTMPGISFQIAKPLELTQTQKTYAPGKFMELELSKTTTKAYSPGKSMEITITKPTERIYSPGKSMEIAITKPTEKIYSPGKVKELEITKPTERVYAPSKAIAIEIYKPAEPSQKINTLLKPGREVPSPIIPIGGGMTPLGFSSFSYKPSMRISKQKARYTPSLTAQILNIRGPKPSKMMSMSGFGIRPIVTGKKKKRR